MANPIKPVLRIVTSHPIKGDAGQATGFWLSELTHALAVLQDAGIRTELASVRGGQPPSGMFNEAWLKRSIEIVGCDRILFSTDYPYQYRPGRDARRFLEALSLDDDKRKFAHANWERLTDRQ